MQRNILGNQKGIAILVTLTVISVVVVIGLELNKKARSAVVRSALVRDRVTMSEMAKSGVHAAMAMLVKDKLQSETDNLQEDWAVPEMVQAVVSELPFDRGKLTVAISDESGRLPVNALVVFPQARQFDENFKAVWDRLLRRLSPDSGEGGDQDPGAILNSIKDWLDKGDDDAITGVSGAESDYYENLDPPYACKNGPMDHLSELTLIKGVTRELVYGAEEMPGLYGLATVYGAEADGGESFSFAGKVNLGTAPFEVIAALLPDEDEELAAAIVEYRTETTDGETFLNDISGTQWYKSVPGASQLALDGKITGFSSDVFRVRSMAELDGKRLLATAVVQRVKDEQSGNWGCRILNWETAHLPPAKAESTDDTDEP